MCMVITCWWLLWWYNLCYTSASWWYTSFSTCFHARSNRTLYIDGLVHDCSNSSALAMELLQFCTKPSIYYCTPKSPIHSVILFILHSTRTSIHSTSRYFATTSRNFEAVIYVFKMVLPLEYLINTFVAIHPVNLSNVRAIWRFQHPILWSHIQPWDLLVKYRDN